VGRVRGGKRLPLGHKYADERTSHPYLRVTDFVDFGIDDSGLQYLSSATHRAIERYTISTKDVYISIAGSIGLVGQVPAHLDNANLTENAAKITDLQGVEPKFLVYWLASPTGRRLIAKSTIATTQSKLALFRVEKLPLPLPPIDEQRRIVAKVDRRLSIVREVEAEVDANLKRAQALRQAVLARAFAGANEAVPSST
jgi:restriction endonuclease S subunit